MQPCKSRQTSCCTPSVSLQRHKQQLLLLRIRHTATDALQHCTPNQAYVQHGALLWGVSSAAKTLWHIHANS